MKTTSNKRKRNDYDETQGPNVFTPAEADVPKLSWVHMGCVRPKINNVAVVY